MARISSPWAKRSGAQRRKNRVRIIVSLRGCREVYRDGPIGLAGRRVCSARCGVGFRHRSLAIAVAARRRPYVRAASSSQPRMSSIFLRSLGSCTLLTASSNWGTRSAISLRLRLSGAERRAGIIETRRGTRYQGSLRLQTIEHDLHALRHDGGGLHVLPQLADLGDQSLQCLGVRRRGLGTRGGSNDQSDSGAKHALIVLNCV